MQYILSCCLSIAALSAFAEETPSVTARPSTSATSASPRNRLLVGLGVDTQTSSVGLTYERVLASHVTLAATGSFGLRLQEGATSLGGSLEVSPHFTILDAARSGPWVGLALQASARRLTFTQDSSPQAMTNLDLQVAVPLGWTFLLPEELVLQVAVRPGLSFTAYNDTPQSLGLIGGRLPTSLLAGGSVALGGRF